MPTPTTPETIIQVLQILLPAGYLIVRESEDGQSKPMGEKEAAAYLKTSVHVLRRLHTNGLGPPFRKIGRDKVYLCEDLDRWIKEEPSFRSPTQYRAAG